MSLANGSARYRLKALRSPGITATDGAASERSMQAQRQSEAIAKDIKDAPMRPLNYQIIFEVEDEHWWFVGRRQIVFTQIEDALSQTPVASRSASEAPSRP